MARQNQQISNFGICFVSFVDINDGKPLYDGTVEATGGLSLDASVDLITNNGGCRIYPIATGQGKANTELTFNINVEAKAVDEVIYGEQPDISGDETNGFIGSGKTASVGVNKKGTSAFNATTGVASLAVISGEESKLRNSNFTVEFVSPTTVNVYAIDHLANNKYADNSLKINATPLTITNGGNVPVTYADGTSAGFELVGGSAVAATAGDTFTFETRPKNVYSSVFKAGRTEHKSKAVGMYVFGARASDSEQMKVFLPNVVISSNSISFTQDEFQSKELSGIVLPDTENDFLYEVTAIKENRI